MSHDDFDFEPRRGIPAPLPEGERLLWQGSPDFRGLAVRAYHVRKVAIYFALLLGWRLAMAGPGALTARSTLIACSLLALLGLAALGILATLAWLSSRAAVYSITSRRVLIRHGIAVPLTLNVPFKSIASADLKVYANGAGDIALRVFADQRVGYLINWPYLRQGFLARPQPSLRALPEAARVADILAAALSRACGATAAAPAASNEALPDVRATAA
jgi:Bacterial PH domain